MKIAGIITVCIGVMVFGLGVLLLGLGGYLFFKEQLFLKKAELTTAVVTENKRYTYTGQVNEYGVQHYYCSEFQFQTRAGQRVSFEEQGCAQIDQPPDYQVGQKVEVYYDPQDPVNTVQMRGDSLHYTGAIAATVAGVLSALIGLGLFWLGLRMRRSAGKQ
jgi:hypothetical protein